MQGTWRRGNGFEALGACDWLEGWHQQALAGLGTAVGGYMVGGAHHWVSTSGYSGELNLQSS